MESFLLSLDRKRKIRMLEDALKEDKWTIFKEFSKIFNFYFMRKEIENSSFDNFTHMLKNTPKLFRFYNYFKRNIHECKRAFYEDYKSDFGTKEYKQETYLSTQEFSNERTTQPVATDVIGEIKTKKFNGTIKRYT